MLVHFYIGSYVHLSPKNISNYIQQRESLGVDKQIFLISNPHNKLSEASIKTYQSLFNENDMVNSFMIWKTPIEVFRVLINIHKNDTIIFHSIVDHLILRYLIYLILFCSRRLKNVILICWNLSDAFVPLFSFKIKLYNILNWFFIKRFKKVVLISKEDKELFESYYSGNNSALLPLLRAGQEPEYRKYQKTDAPLGIMVSHSGWEHNNHLKSFKLIERFKEENIVVVCPLCYGNQSYINKIISVGKQIFGDKFIYFTTLAPYEEYVQYLNQEIAIYITAAQVQTGIGTVNVLLRSGAKVFAEGNILESYRSMGITMGTTKDLLDLNYAELKSPIDDNTYKDNMNALSEFYDPHTILEKYKEILKADLI